MKTMRWSVMGFVAAAVLAFCAAQAARAAEEIPRVLIYPPENIDLNEGTIECWFKFVDDKTDTKEMIFTFFNLSGQEGGIIASYSWSGIEGKSGMWYIRPWDQGMPFGTVGPEYKKETWYHIALVWNDKDTILYVDGKLQAGGKGTMSKRTHPVSFARMVGKLVGKPVYGGTPFCMVVARSMPIAVDDVRVSKIARKPEELGFAVGELKPDIFTAILDNFETTFEPDGVKLTKPLVILHGEGGLSPAGSKFVDGKFGKALQIMK